MKRFLIWFGIIISCTTSSFAYWGDSSAAFSSDSRTTTVSNNSASPTHLLTRETFIVRNYIVNTSTFTIFLSSVSTNLSTSSFGIPGTPSGATPVIWSPDGVNSPYGGDLWAFVNTVSTPSVSVYRSK